MKTTYRGYEIEAKRERSLGGDTLLYFSIFSPDGEEILSNFTTGSDTVKTYIEILKQRVDERIDEGETSDDDEGII